MSGDEGKVVCEGCGKRVWPVTHSCTGIRPHPVCGDRVSVRERVIAAVSAEFPLDLVVDNRNASSGWFLTRSSEEIVADAALAVLTDPETVAGIAAVLVKHRSYYHADWGWVCSCGHRPSGLDVLGELATHQAEQVAAYLAARP